jgi:2-phosphosulfolactate phosphatase
LHETEVGDFLKRLRVLMTRQEIVPERLAGATVVVIDVFMATTTLLTILENGARDVYPVASLEEADEVRAKLEVAGVLRGGEQDAARIDGYDHGPFPEEYAPEVVGGKDVIFLTTNGTRAIADVAPADTVLLGTLRNAGAVAHHLEAAGTDSIYLVCAGAGSRFNVEDFLGAATVLSRMDVDGFRLNDGALLALDFAQRHEEDFYETLQRSRAGRWFVENDKMDAFDFVADVDASGLVPEVVGGKLRRANEHGSYVGDAEWGRSLGERT